MSIAGRAVRVVLLVALGSALLPGAAGPPPGAGAGPVLTSLILRSAERRGISLRADIAADATGINLYRSLAVTDTAILGNFSFQSVMERLACPAERACPAGDVRREALALYHQWWDTQNEVSPGPGPKCRPTLFDFPYQCPRREGLQIAADPFSDSPPGSGYVAIGLFNRIDLLAADGSDCGEYRIVFARRSGQLDGNNRLLVNFEAVLPNPQPATGIAGCKPVAQFWKDLTAVPGPADRVPLLRAFYFTGLPGFPPVVHADHYGTRFYAGPGGVQTRGQVRTNQFGQGPWVLREFRLVRPCPHCAPGFVPDRLAQTPFGGLFGATSAHPQAQAFQDTFVTLVGQLTTGDANTLTYDIPRLFETAQSESCDPGNPLMTCLTQPVDGQYLLKTDAAFTTRIQGLLPLGGALSAEHIVKRAMALSCAGCHQLSSNEPLGAGLLWPTSLEFVHVSERSKETRPGADGEGYEISPALKETFLPYRAGKLAGVLAQ